MDGLYDLVIIGSGPAGLAAAIYARRARLNAVVLEKEMISGGQVLTTEEVDNYPGLPGINGFALGTKFREHADALGVVFAVDEVVKLSDFGDWKEIEGREKTYKTKTVIIASGAVHQKLGVPGEDALSGMGVSYCATCDGAFFRKKTVAVVGGGDVALEDAIFLSRICEKVYLIHRRDELRGAKVLQERLFSLENVEVIWDTVVEAIEGTDRVEGLRVKQVKSGQVSRLEVNGVFIAVGIKAQSSAFEGVVAMENSYLCAGEDGATSVPGIFAAGDVRTKPLRQIITAAADGANAVASVERYLNLLKK